LENGTTVFIDACDFAVQKGVLNPKILSDPVGQVLEAAKGVSVSRDEATLTGFDKARRTIPIDLEFEQIIVGVERFRTARKPHGVQVWEDEHSKEYNAFGISQRCTYR